MCIGVMKPLDYICVSNLDRLLRKILIFITLLGAFVLDTQAQGNKLSIQSTSPKNMSICGFSDTVTISVFNISSGGISGIKATVSLPIGVKYVPGSINSATATESNISNLNQPVFSNGNILIAQNFKFRIRITVDCDLLAKLSGNYNPQIDVRVDYTGNYDLGSSIPFVPNVPSPLFSSISNKSITTDVGSSFIRTFQIKNFGKGPLANIYVYRINGKDLSNKGPKGAGHSINGDTTISNLSASFFKKIGNSDSLFDQNESFSFSDTITVNGCKSISSSYLLIWGCGGKFCQIIKDNGSVTISSKSPNITSWVNANSSTCYNISESVPQELVITNNGQLPAEKTSVIVYQTYSVNAPYYQYIYSELDTGTIYIKTGKNGTYKRFFTDSVVVSYKYSCLSANPIGVFRLKLGTINVKDTIYIKWDIHQCSPNNCPVSFYSTGWSYSLDFYNACGDINFQNPNNGLQSRSTYGSASMSGPTDIGKSITEKYRFTFGSVNFLPMTSSGIILVDFILPKTISHSLSTNDFHITDYRLTSFWYPDSIKLINDTLRGYFGNKVKFGLTNGEIKLKITGDCSNSSKNENLNLGLSVKYIPDRTCKPYSWIYLICNSYPIKVHCSNLCSGGMQFKNFNVERTSFGIPDNNNDGLPDGTGTIDSANIRTDRAMVGDTVTAYFYGRPKSAGGANTTWRNGFAESVVTYGNYLDVIGAELIVIRGTTVTSTNCNSVRYRKVRSGQNATFYFNFSVDSIYSGGCLSSTFRFGANDSIILKVKYKITSNLGGNVVSVLFKNRYYLSNYAAPTLAQSFQCDTFNGSFNYYSYYFTNYGPANYNYTSCGLLNISQSYYLGIGPCCSNYAGADVFPYEYRNWAKISKLLVTLPAGLKMVSASMGQYRTSGIGSYVHEPVNPITPVAGTNNPYVYDLSKLHKSSGGTLNQSDDGFQGYVNCQVQPLCNFPANAIQNISYDYIFEKQNALGSGFDTLYSDKMGTSDKLTFLKPNLKLTPAIPTVYANSDTAEWIVNYGNSSSNFQVYNIWLSPKSNTNIKVVEIRDAANDTLIKPVNDIYRAGILSAGKNRSFKIRATYNNCAPDSLIMYGSWNCDNYPSDFATYPCLADRVALYLEPKNTRLQLTLKDSISKVDLCTSNRFDLLLENIQDVKSYNNKIQITLPIGMNIVNNSVKYRYVASGGWVSYRLPQYLSGTVYEWDLDKTISGVSKGFSGTQDTSRNKIQIQFRVETDCNYASGSYIITRATANLKCGDPVPVIPAYSNPVDIKGITRPYYTLTTLKSDSIFPCTAPFYGSFKTIFLGPSASGTKDRVEVILPAGITWDSSYFLNIRKSPNKDSVTVANYSGATLVSWLLPSNILPGDSVEFKTRFTASSVENSCGPKDLLVRSVVVQSALCVKTNTYCDIKVITGGDLANPIVDKGSLNLSAISGTSRLIKADTEALNLTFKITNTGQKIIPGSRLIFKYYYDLNNSGKWDASDIYVANDTIYTGFNTNQVLNHSVSLKVRAGYGCGILAVVDSSACSCLFGQVLFPTPRMENAGRDTAVCSGSNLLVGTPSSYYFNYTWNNDIILDKATIPRPGVIVANQSGKPETYELILNTKRGTCYSKDTIMVTINPNPTVKVSVKDTQLCQGKIYPLNLNVKSGVTPYSYAWGKNANIPDTTVSNLILKPDSSSGFFIKVTDKNNCKAWDSSKVTIFNNPTANFTFSPVCDNVMLAVENKSKIGYGANSKLTWQTPVWDTLNVDKTTIPMFGKRSETLILIIENDAACKDSMTKTIWKYKKPTASFSMQDHCFKDANGFANTSFSDSGVIAAYKWWQNGTQYSADSSPVFNFNQAGIWTVKLETKSAYGCVDSMSKNIIVYAIPKANFTFNTACENENLILKSQSTVKNDTIIKWRWTSVQGGGLDSFMQYNLPNHDSFMVKLVIESSHQCRDSISKQVKFYDIPKAKFGFKNVCDKVTAIFNDSSTIENSAITKYNWKLGDGNVSAVKNANHLYASEGNYPVQLNVVSAQGCKDSIIQNIDIYPLLNATIQANNHCLGLSIPIGAALSGNGTLDSLMWDLGDGTKAVGNNLTHLYAMPGSYNLTLRTKTANGCNTFANKLIEVYPLPQINAITANNACSDDSIIFSANTSITKGSIIENKWIHTDNSNTFTTDFYKIFPNPGTYSSQLIVESNQNCVDSSQVNYTVYQKTIPAFSGMNVCKDEETFFTNLSKAYLPITKYNWAFGDGQNSSLQNPSHFYNKANTYMVNLEIETAPNCKYNYNNTVIVYPKPIPAFNYNPLRTNITNSLITFTNQAQGADSIWYSIDYSQTFRQANFSYRFPDSGYYKVNQYASTSFGCMDSTREIIYVDFIYTLHIPTAFTPNGNGRNEIFKPEGLGLTYYKLQVYDRWGGKVFDGENKGWDGTYDGLPVMDGVYSILITVKDYTGQNHFHRGIVHVLR